MYLCEYVYLYIQPYLGLTESPGAFVRGVGKGSVSLLKGMALSTASILGSATDSVSTVTQSVATGTWKLVVLQK